MAVSQGGVPGPGGVYLVWGVPGLGVGASVPGLGGVPGLGVGVSVPVLGVHLVWGGTWSQGGCTWS